MLAGARGNSNARRTAANHCRFGADDRTYRGVLGVSVGNDCLAGISPLGEAKVEGQKSWGRRFAMMLNSVDECRQRADECRHSAAQIVTDDVLRGAYLDLARLWHKMEHQAQQKEFGTDTAPSSRADLPPGYSPAIMRSTAIIAQGINKLLACAALNPRAPQTANGSAPEIT
jgi:hypothetical protein